MRLDLSFCFSSEYSSLTAYTRIMMIGKFQRTRAAKCSWLTCLLLLGCVFAQETPPDFQVVPVYEGQLAFIEALQTEPDLSLIEKTDLYREFAVDPYMEGCARDEERFVQGIFGYEVTQLEAWESAIQELTAADIAGTVEEAAAKAASLLPADPITFCVFALHPDDSFVIEEMGGVTGVTRADTLIYLPVYPVTGWLDRLEHTVAHEYHHAASRQRSPDGRDASSLTDRLISEGKADSFAKLVYPNAVAPWTEALSPQQERKQWEALQPHLETRSPDFQGQIMFGSDDYPLWTGYTIGFNIVQAFLEKHPEMDVEAWTELDAQELLERSDYAP